MNQAAATTPHTVFDKWLPSIYFVLGQGGWFACVLGAARGFAWLGVVVALALVALHVARVARPRVELKLIASVVLLGGAWESLVIASAVLVYPPGAVIHGLPPLWLLTLWALFAVQFNTTYKWLKPHLPLAAVLGAVAGPLSFRAGAALGALHFAKPLPAYVMLAIGWAVLLPLITVISRRFDGVRSTDALVIPQSNARI